MLNGRRGATKLESAKGCNKAGEHQGLGLNCYRFCEMRTVISQSGPRKTNKSNALCMKELLILPSPVKKVYPDIKSVTLSHQGQQQNKIIKWTPPPNVLNIIFFGPWLPAAAPAHIWNIDGRTSLNDCRPMLKNLGYLFSRHCGLKNSPALGICTLRAPSAHVGSRPMAYPN